MTTPATAQQLATLAQDEQAGESAALENQVVGQADAGTSGALDSVLAAALAGWIAGFGATTVAGAGLALAAYLARTRAGVDQATMGLGVRASRVVADALPGAALLGARHAAQFASRASGHRLSTPQVGVTADALDAARGIAAAVRTQLVLSARLLSPSTATTWRDVVLGIAAARRALTLIRQATAWAVHRAINAGAAQASDALRARGLWVAEPTACVRCLAYSGRLTDSDGQFPGGLSLDPHQRALHAAAIDGPPLHPSCRCKPVPWRSDWGRADGMSLPDLLRQQAWSSAATGRARPSESRAARIRAARHVSTQAGVPARVRQQARAAVAAGHF